MRAETEKRGIGETGIPNTSHEHESRFFCNRWRCTMAKRVCLMRRHAAKAPVNRFDVGQDPQAMFSFDQCLHCEQGGRIGLEFGLRPPKHKPAPTERRCRRCGILRPIDQFSKYTYSSGWRWTCKVCRAKDNARYQANKRAREAGQGRDHRFRTTNTSTSHEHV